jgi:hypothetical protein
MNGDVAEQLSLRVSVTLPRNSPDNRAVEPAWKHSAAVERLELPYPLNSA